MLFHWGADIRPLVVTRIPAWIYFLFHHLTSILVPDLKLIPPSGSSNVSLLVNLLDLLLLLNLSGGLPVESLQSLGQNGVREMVSGEQPVRIHSAEVLDLELDQGASELGVVAKLVGELVGLEFELAAENVHSELDEGIGGAKDVREEKEPNNDWVHRVETKVGIEWVVVDENREEGEDGKEVGLVLLVTIQSKRRRPPQRSNQAYLRDAKEASGMTQLPVTQLVRKNSNNLLGLALLNQGIVDNNVLLPGHAEEVSVAVGATLATVNDVQLRERELELLGQILDAALELTLLKGRELVEQRQNEDGVDGDHDDLETSDENPEVVEELVSSLLHNSQKASEDRRRKDERQEERLDLVGDPELGRRLVETELLLQDESVVEAGRQRENLGDNDEGQDEDDRLRDFAREPGWRKPNEEVAGEWP